MQKLDSIKAGAFLAGVMVLVTIGMAQAAPQPRESAAASRGLDSVPIESRYAISAEIGLDQPGYHARQNGSALAADNPGQDMSIKFGATGVEIGAGVDGFAVHPVQWGYGDTLVELAAGIPRALDNIITVQHGTVSQWYVNGPLGLQQGFTVAERPQAGSGPLKIAMAIQGARAGKVDDDGKGQPA
jgi:hypothetical protein